MVQTILKITPFCLHIFSVNLANFVSFNQDQIFYSSECTYLWIFILFLALRYHFETMVLPTPLSWYAYHLPLWVLKLAAVFTNICQMVLPFLFFAPIRSIRITGFTIQVCSTYIL